MIRAVIFDMDGCFIDSEPLHREAWNRIAEKYNLYITEEEYSDFVGKGAITVAQYIKENGENVDKPPDEIIGWKKQVLLDLDTRAKTRPGAKELAEDLSKKYTIGLASSTGQPIIKKFLEKTNTRHLFDFTVGGDEVENLKPAPDIYLLAAERAGATPSECITFEDSLSGVKAAKNAGIKCIAIPNEETKKFNFEEADYTMESFEEASKSWDDILRTVEGTH